ncbi:MAG: class I SAM-dependent methyltransferase, partial [Asgard group archaeon]|nr:class I SAM-dependent methyltransferase [Asgard group archaeon]
MENYLLEFFNLADSIKESISDFQRDILGIIFSIELQPKDQSTNEYIIGDDRKIKLDFEGISAIGKNRFGEKINDLAEALNDLLEMNLLTVDKTSYALTLKGKELGKKIRTKWISESYGNLLLRCAESQAYANFCEKVCGKNLLQFNVVDMQQLEMMLEKLEIKPNETLIDLGCGLGKITEYIAQKTGAKTIGIDFAEKGIQWAKTNTKEGEKLSYEVMDISELNYQAETFDVITALDVL